MMASLLGNKVGMTQLFDDNKMVVPVTVINVSDWLVTQIKAEDKDGYASLQVGKVKNRFVRQPFSQEWLSKKKDYFCPIKEIRVTDTGSFSLGQKIDISEHMDIKEGDYVNISGISKGLGFQGVVKRYSFAGGPGGHGSMFHRIPGSIGHMRRQGEVIKGQKLPGHCGARRITVKGLLVVRVDKETGHIFLRGSVPGKKNSLIYISKQG